MTDAILLSKLLNNLDSDMKTQNDDLSDFGFDYIEVCDCGNCGEQKPCAVLDIGGPSEVSISLCSGCLVDLANVVFEYRTLF